jgi:hypothetical protein
MTREQLELVDKFLTTVTLPGPVMTALVAMRALMDDVEWSADNATVVSGTKLYYRHPETNELRWWFAIISPQVHTFSSHVDCDDYYEYSIHDGYVDPGECKNENT